ncbi:MULTISPECIES: hypothetical protein [unclassified Mycoplasma]|uniref:hypothetical protein n=1 Tax=unclassified Mycoplasma TaxID=2683645 RepID=UPI001C10A130|nr:MULTISPECIES: hypothetical protein [unclassified Mycoplasma]MBU4693229.1 hypothetical protein [Mycoplasma sp. CSL7491-lung]MCU4707025.1 hypothetical protein [Mycoplasma sp. CSL7503-lung]
MTLKQIIKLIETKMRNHIQQFYRIPLSDINFIIKKINWANVLPATIDLDELLKNIKWLEETFWNCYHENIHELTKNSRGR